MLIGVSNNGLKLSEKTIIIGQTGVYEIDDDNLTISSLKFIKPRKYIRDEAATKEKLTEGAKTMHEAEKARAKAITGLTLNDNYDDSNKESFLSNWASYIAAQNAFSERYPEGLALY